MNYSPPPNAIGGITNFYGLLFRLFFSRLGLLRSEACVIPVSFDTPKQTRDINMRKARLLYFAWWFRRLGTKCFGRFGITAAL